jgi:hypothetical protein
VGALSAGDLQVDRVRAEGLEVLRARPFDEAEGLVERDRRGVPSVWLHVGTRDVLERLVDHPSQRRASNAAPLRLGPQLDVQLGKVVVGVDARVDLAAEPELRGVDRVVAPRRVRAQASEPRRHVLRRRAQPIWEAHVPHHRAVLPQRRQVAEIRLGRRPQLDRWTAHRPIVPSEQQRRRVRS